MLPQAGNDQNGSALQSTRRPEKMQTGKKGLTWHHTDNLDDNPGCELSHYYPSTWTQHALCQHALCVSRFSCCAPNYPRRPFSVYCDMSRLSMQADCLVVCHVACTPLSQLSYHWDLNDRLQTRLSFHHLFYPTVQNLFFRWTLSHLTERDTPLFPPPILSNSSESLLSVNSLSLKETCLFSDHLFYPTVQNLFFQWTLSHWRRHASFFTT